MTPTSATIGEAAQDYARHLSVAALKAGACGRVHVQSPDADSGATTAPPHEQWPSGRCTGPIPAPHRWCGAC